MQPTISPIELCLESLNSIDDDQPYMRCVAISGAQPGLGITADGVIVWCQSDAASALLWVSADNQLILIRERETEMVRLIRGERFLDLPLEKPVLILTDDIVVVGEYSFRIHVHGVAQTVAAPVRLALRRMNSMVVGAAIAAVSVAGCHTAPGTGAPASSTTAVSSSVPIATSSGGASTLATLAGTGGAAPTSNSGLLGDVASMGGSRAVTSSSVKLHSTKVAHPPIEVREHPPKPMPTPDLRN